MRGPVVSFALAILAAGVPSSSASAQELPLAPLRGAEQGVWPAFEGWYDAGDGTYIIYFGYNNRNAEEVIEIPLGEANFIEPAEYDGDQPTRFEPRRDWGVFGIRVPADFPPTDRIYWNLVIDGRTYRVPGHLQADYKTDALGGGAADAYPPWLTVDGAEGAGPMGVTAPQTRRARVGEAVELTVAAKQEGATTSGLAAAFGALAGMGARGGIQVTWFKHRGLGDVTFSSQTERIAGREGEATTIATFAAPGEYVVRMRANGSDIAGSGHAQCCWSNAFFNVSVTR